MCDVEDCNCLTFSMDSKTPINLSLSAYFKRSFAFFTVKDRMPIILTKIIDHLVRDKEEIVKEFGEESREEIKTVIGEISKLKYEIQTNKPLTKFDSDIPDTKVYDWYIEEQATEDGAAKYFTTIWLLVECYMYRRLRFIFESTQSLVKYDPFLWQKKEAFCGSLPAIQGLIDYFIPLLKVGKVDVVKELNFLFKLGLWSNKCDLSISGGEGNNEVLSPNDIVRKYDEFLLCNHFDFILESLTKCDEDCESETSSIENDQNVIEIVCDNAGFELMTDFCLADFLITHELASKVIFNLKNIPWFVSDTTINDLRWTIRHLISSEHPHLKKIGIRWNKYIREKNWILEDDSFWTSPVDYTYMESLKPELYERLKKAKMVIFKGDLNYRKLFGEKNWESTTPPTVAKQNFSPTKWCVLRTLKSDIICGLKKGVAEKLDETQPDWLVSGAYGVIQFSEVDGTMMDE